MTNYENFELKYKVGRLCPIHFNQLYRLSNGMKSSFLTRSLEKTLKSTAIYAKLTFFYQISANHYWKWN